MMVKEFKFISSEERLPDIKTGKSISKAILASVKNVFFIGHFHRNGQFYLFNNLGSAKTVSTVHSGSEPEVVFWAYL